MKKILFLLLCTVSIYGQTSTGQEQEFDYGIKNNSLQTITTPTYIGTFGTDGTQGKIPSALIEKTDNKQNSLAVDGMGVKYPTVDAVNSGFLLKQNSLNWKTPQDYGAIGDGIADDTAAIQACLTANSNVFLYGSYKTTASLELFSDQFIFSNNATIARSSTDSAIMAALNRENIQIKGALTLVGGGNSIGTNSGIRMTGVDNFKIDGVVFKDISGVGLWISSGAVTFPRGEGGLISNIQAINCYVGLQFDYGYQGEYHSVVNFNATECNTGANIYAGNISLSGGNIVDNTLGIYLGGTLTSNNSHGILNGLNVNHNTLNLRVDVAEFGQTISNCHFYGDAVNNIEIINSKGLIFTNCIIDGKVSNSDTNSPKGAHLVSSSQIGNLTTFYGDYIKKRDNITLTGVDYVGNDYDWGLNGNAYMYAGATGQRFAYSLAGSNVLYSGTDSFGINDQSDATRLLNLTNSGVFSLNNLSGIGNRLVYSDASGNLSAPDVPTAPTATVGTNTTQIATTAFVAAGLATKQNTLTNPITGTGTTNTIPKFTASGTIGNSSITDNGTTVTINLPTTIKGTIASDGGQLGSELTTTATGTNWTGTGFGTGYTHTTGSTVALTTTLAAVINNLYQITYTVTGRTTGSITINFGGIAIGGITASGNSGPKATTTEVLTLTPTTDFNGTVVVSVKVISASSATQTWLNSSGGVANEFRASSSNTNLFFGVNAGSINTTGVNNNAVGYAALQNNTTGVNNNAVGYAALLNNTTGNNNSAVGYAALLNNTIGNANSAVGYGSLQNNTTGGANSAVGYGSLQNNTTGGGNSAVGTSALQNNTTGNNNNAVGQLALLNNTTGVNNNAVGRSALQNNTTGSNNSATGDGAGRYNTIGNANSAVGREALQNNTTGSNNSATGDSAGRYIADKSTPATILNNSILIGYRTSPLADNQTNQVVIGYDAIGLGSNSTVIGNSSTTTARVYGRQLVNTSTDNGTDQLQVNGTISASAATTANQVVIKSQLDAAVPYKKYVALISQTGTSAPTATVLENTLGGAVVWTRSGIGSYQATLTGSVYTSSKTVVFATIGLNKNLVINGARVSDSVVSIMAGTGDLDSTNMSIEIRVYN